MYLWYFSHKFVAMYFILQLSKNWPYGILKIFVLKKSLTTSKNQVPESAILLQKLPIVQTVCKIMGWNQFSSIFLFLHSRGSTKVTIEIRYKLETLL